ncbi:MAG: bifunctional metallophosphatase/5'-nucleotidase [Gammaproteobacteria bacterium]
MLIIKKSAFFKIITCLIIGLFSPVYSQPLIEEPVIIKVLGINDFHGQISEGVKLNNRAVGSAPILAAFIKKAQQGYENSNLIALMGDQISASPPASGLLNDEPTILFLNSLANKECSADARMNPQCNMVATIGNHEFDKGQKALLEKIYGSDKPPVNNWINLPRYPGASYPHVSANIVDAKTGEPLFPPYVIKKTNGITIAFIGAILKDANEVITPSSLKGMAFLDEAKTINHYATEVKAKGADVVIVIIHQGGKQEPYEGSTHESSAVEGKIVDVIKQFDDNVDVVMSGHTHAFMNAFLPNHHGKKILVTEANSYSASFAEVTLAVDKHAKAVLSKSARIITTYADECPETTVNLPATKITKLAEEKVAPMIKDPVGVLQTDLIKKVNSGGESSLGDFVADAMREEAGTDIALMNPGGLRANLYAGNVTYGSLYAIQPFGNLVLKISLTGQDIYELLEQQWTPNNMIFLQVSGLSYRYDVTKPIGSRIVTIYHDGQLLQRDKVYTVATNDFLAHGGDGFTVMRRGKIINEVEKDLTLLIHYIKNLPQPFSSGSGGRIQEVKT